MEGINPNTPTSTTPEKIEQSGGDSPASFDDLDFVTNYDGVPSKQDGQEIEKTKAKGDKNESKEKSKKSSEKENEVNDNSDGADETEETKAAPKEKTDEKEAVKKPEGKQPKFIKTKNGEEDLSIRADAPIEVMINGKKESVPIQELINQFSGKQDWSKKYSDLDKEKKTFTKERETLDNTWKEFFKLSTQDKNPVAAINMLGEISGQDMVKFWKDFRGSLEPVIEARLKLSPEERRIADLEDEVNLRTNLDDRRKNQAQSTQERQEYVMKIDKMRDEAGLTQDEFVKLHEELKNSGQLTKEQLKPELVIAYHKELAALKTLNSLLGEVNSEMKGPELNDATNDLRKVWMDNPDLTIEEIKKIAAEVWGDKSAKNLSRKLAKSEPVKNYKPEKSRNGDPVSFDDID